MIKRLFLICALTLCTSLLPAQAQEDTARLDQIEQALRQLTGQVEELTFQLKQLQAENQKRSETQPQAAPQKLPKKAAVLAVSPEGEAGIEQIGETPVADAVAQPDQQNVEAVVSDATKPLGVEKPVPTDDGGFQGQVIVGLTDTAASVPSVAPLQEVAAPQEVAPEAKPDEVFLSAEKSLLQMQYAEAEIGFKDFVTKFPTHNLAGSAQFKLGETFWARQDYSNAAQSYMNSYKQYPKGRRAPDSLLKLGLSLNRLGQQDQGCAMISAVETEYPNAVEIKKRAQAEFRRAGCP